MAPWLSTARNLDETPFNPRRYYSVVVGADGLTVYSECCADTMSRETARLVHDALGRYLAETGDGQQR